MNHIIEDDAKGQGQAEAAGGFARPKQHQSAQDKPSQTPAPYGLQTDHARRDWPFPAVLPVKLSVASIVQKHSAEVKKSGADEQEGKVLNVAATAEPPSCHTVGPDSGQVGDAA